MHVEIKTRKPNSTIHLAMHVQTKKIKRVESNRKGPALDFHEWKRNENSFWSTRDKAKVKSFAST